MITVTIAWTVAFFFANLLQCLPISVSWSGLGYLPGACINTSQMYLAQAYSDIGTDGKPRKETTLICLADSDISQCSYYHCRYVL